MALQLQINLLNWKHLRGTPTFQTLHRPRKRAPERSYKAVEVGMLTMCAKNVFVSHHNEEGKLTVIM